MNRLQALKIYKTLLRVMPSQCLYNYGQRSFGFILNSKRYDIEGDKIKVRRIG